MAQGKDKEEKLEALARQLTLVKVSLTNAKNQLNAGKVVPAVTINELQVVNYRSRGGKH